MSLVSSIYRRNRAAVSVRRAIVTAMLSPRASSSWDSGLAFRGGRNHKDTKDTKIRKNLCVLCVFVVLFYSYEKTSLYDFNGNASGMCFDGNTNQGAEWFF